MLTKLWSPAFQRADNPNRAIRFHAGLNLIEGGKRARNSIGKSTLLEIIDFVYGGNAFSEAGVVLLPQAVGHHTIYFSLKIDGKEHYFSRNTERHGYLIRYTDDNWAEEEKEIALTEYHHFLRHSYALEYTEGTWRDLVGRFSRLNEEVLGLLDEPLAKVAKEGTVTGATTLLRLFNAYQDTVQLQQNLQKVNSELTTLNGMTNGRYSRYIAIRTKKERTSAEKTLKKLKSEAEQLRIGSDLDLFDAEVQARKEQESARAVLRPLTEALVSLQGRLANVEQVLEGKTRITNRDLGTFYKFFPEANSEQLETVEYYHHELSQILQSQLEEQRQLYEAQIAQVKHNIDAQQRRIFALGQSVQLDEETYARTLELHRKVLELEEQIRTFDHKTELASQVKTLRTEAKENLPLLLSSVEETINQEMALISREFDTAEGRRIPPHFKFKEAKKGIGYVFDHCGDEGSGAKARHLTIFDVSILRTTPLPFIIHDSAIFKLIEHEPIQGFLKAYVASADQISGAGEPKQVFCSFDATKIYGAEAEKIVEKNRVLRLSGGERTLYGANWNLLANEEAQE